MSNAAPGPETPPAEPATPLAGRAPELLAELAELGMAAARAFQAQVVKAANAGDLDRAAVAEAGFNRSALGVRRAIALDAKLTRRKQETAREVDDRRRLQRMQADDRRREAARRVGRVIAQEPDAGTRERLTADLWTRLTEDDRIDADSEDTILPLEVLVARLCRQLGLPPDWPDATGPAGGPSGGGAAEGGPAAEETRWTPPPPPPTYDYTPGRYVLISAADLGLEGDKIYNLNKTTGEVFDPDTDKLFRVLSTGPDDTGPPAEAPPGEAAQPPPQAQPVPPPLAGGGQGEGVASAASGPLATAPPDTEAERKRQQHRLRQEEARKFGLTLPDLP
jgi:hypothetical protein